MSRVYSILAWVTILLAVTLLLDALLARRWPLVVAALWNAALLTALVLAPAVWLLPRWEVPLLPAEIALAPPPREVAIETGNQPGGAQSSVQAVRDDELLSPSVHETLAAAPPRPNRPWDLRQALLAVYLLGVGIALVRLLASASSVAKLRGRAVPVESVAWQMRLAAWSETIAPRRRVALLESSEVAVPLVIGWWRPAIMVPPELVAECETLRVDTCKGSSATIDAVLVHELAHIERADCGWQLVERAVQVVYWFHPLLWLTHRRVAQVRERACDDFAVHLLDSAQAYAETLVSVAARIGARRRLGLAMAVVRTSNLENRLNAIAESAGDSRCRLSAPARWSVLVALLLLAVCGTTTRLVRAQATEQNAPAKESAPAPSSAADKNPAAGGIAGKARTWQEEHAEQFAELIKAGKFDQAAEMFSPDLRKKWPGDKLQELFESIAAAFGRLNDHSSLLTDRVGNTELTAVMLIWGKQMLSVRLLFDDAKQIDGVWFAPHPAVDPLSADKSQLRFRFETHELRSNGLLLGRERPELINAKLSLEIQQLQASGEPVSKITYVSFYRALDAGEPAETNDWHDTKADVTWRFISNESRQLNRAERLLPGTYRAFVSGNKETGYQLSDPIKLDGSQQLTTLELRAKPTATLLAHVVDAQTGAGLEHLDLRIQADDPGLPSYRNGSSDFEQSAVRIEGLLPGRHRITAFCEATRIGERDYRQSDEPQYVELEAGKTAEVTVQLRAAVMADDESARRWPFEVKGRVVDNVGKPVEGAQLLAHSGYGTLHKTGDAISDADGRYTLRFGRGFQLDDSDSTMESYAIIRVAKAGLYNRDLSQTNHLTLVSKLPAAEKRKDRTFVLPNEPHELNFVLAPAVGISAEFEDPAGGRLVGETVWLSANLPRLQKTVASGKTSAEGRFETDGVAPRQSYHWMSPASPFDVRSNPFEFPAPGNYRMVLQLRPDTATGSRFLKIKQVVDTSGHAVTAAVIQDDPVMRDPVPAELQTACHEIVGKMLAFNRLWLDAPPADVKSYQFDVHFDAVAKEHKPQVTYQVEGPDSISLQARHGITYASPLLALSDRGNVVFRALEVTPEKTILAYTFKKPVRIAAGNGVEGFWRGSITAASREGIVVIDGKRNVPLEVQGDMLHEYFENYREVATGEFVPQRIRIDLTKEDGSFGWGFDWKFDLYEPRLWLLSESRDARTPNAPPVMTLDNVKVNGEEARRME